jgi:hypothetical protein
LLTFALRSLYGRAVGRLREDGLEVIDTDLEIQTVLVAAFNREPLVVER